METRKMKEKKDKETKAIEENGTTTPDDDVCQKAPEWAEHSRLQDEDMPCDDGRTGNLERTSAEKQKD